MMKSVLAAALVTWAASAHAQTMTDDQIAEKFVPSAFTAYAANHTFFSDSRTWAVLPVDLDHTGHEDYLAVAYGNGHIAYLSVIQKRATPTLLAESASATECDGSPGVSAIDLDGDGKPELNLSCHVGNHGTLFNSLFKWSAGKLVVLNPPHSRRQNAWTAIRKANFVDLNGDGILEVLEIPADFVVDDQGILTENYIVYSLVNGKLAKASVAPLPYFGMFVRGKGQPQPEVHQFSATPGQYTLTVANGERGQNIVDSGVIMLNGVTIAPPSSFSKKANLTTNVTLAAQNTLSVELQSTPGSLIYVIFTPKYPESDSLQ